MSEQVSQPKLSAFQSPALRIRIYQVLSVFVENGSDAGTAVSALLQAAMAPKADKSSKELIEPLTALDKFLRNGIPLGTALIQAFGSVSAEETAVLSIIPQANTPATGRILVRLVEIVSSLKILR